MAINYDAGTNIITVTGYTEGTPCTFYDIYYADVVGLWGVVTRQCSNQYCFTCRLQMGDGTITTWFADTSQHILFNVSPFSSPIKNFPVTVLVKNHATFRLGKLESAVDKTSSKGCAVIFLNSTQSSINGDGVNGADIEIYSSHLTSRNYFSFIACTENLKVYNTIFGEGMEFHENFGVDLYNLVISNRDYRFGLTNCLGSMDTIKINNVWFALNVTTFDYGESVIFKNIRVRDVVQELMYLSLLNYDDAILINVDSDSWTFKWEPAWPSTKYVVRKYEFDLSVQKDSEVAITNATVKIWDKDDTLVTDTTTDGTGKIATQLLNYGYYKMVTGNTPTMETPHTIEISKAGYKTYKTKFTVNEKIEWRINLLEVQAVQFCDKDLILQLRPESIEDDSYIYTKV